MRNLITGTLDGVITEREIKNAAVSRRAAEEGIILLENKDFLPLKGKRFGLYGSGVRQTVKGGIGSGDVNERKVSTIYDAFKENGCEIASEGWLDEFDKIHAAARNEWKAELEKKMVECKTDLAGAYCMLPFRVPAVNVMTDADFAAANGTDTAIFVISRRAGEFTDRFERKGDWYLYDEEQKLVEQLDKQFENLVIVVNSGGMVDLSFADKLTALKAIVYMSQPGMEAGRALYDVLSGAVTPSGKMTDTWAKSYADYPSSAHFSHNDGDITKAVYEDGIFVGYRYFDTFGVTPRYCFGYGKSYTTFDVSYSATKVEGSAVIVTATVENTGKVNGKEVLQLYVSAPQSVIPKERRRLVAFKKTKLLAPGEKCDVELKFDISDCSSFRTERAESVLDKGDYTLWLGSSLDSSAVVSAVRLDREVVSAKLSNSVSPIAPINEIKPPKFDIPAANEIVAINAAAIPCECGGKKVPLNEKAVSIAAQMDIEELSNVLCGKPCTVVGNAESSLPGAAGETSTVTIKYGVEPIIFSDGPAGIRVQKIYKTDENGRIKYETWMENVEGGFLAKLADEPGTRHYQYLTAFPAGTCLAQSWNEELIYEVGDAIGVEMVEFGVAIWLAPGMNIHRNPLCGRNYEYYSEDPLVSGLIASAVTDGIQSHEGCAVSIKHFACNNQEDNRQFCDSIVSERALRELYLRGFEIAVKKSQPHTLMTSYNLVNGVHSANRADMVTTILRGEWGFKGLVMSDWWSTGVGGASAALCVTAGNDIVMPGTNEDIEEIKKAAESGKIDVKLMRENAARVIELAMSGQNL